MRGDAQSIEKDINLDSSNENGIRYFSVSRLSQNEVVYWVKKHG